MRLSHGVNIVTIFEQMGGKAMTQRVAAALPIKSCQTYGRFHRSLKVIRRYMMPS